MTEKILLVEDEILIAMSQQIELERYGYEVLTANSGKKAIEVYYQTPDTFDLILMDIDLGSGMDGTETARQILAEQDIPVVFLSSHTEPEVVKKTEEITSYGYVVKNSNMTVLDASIKMALKLFDEKQKVTESEHRYQSLVNSMQEGVGIHRAVNEGETFEYVDLNDTGLKLGGKTREEVVGKISSDVFPEIKDSGLLEVFKEVYKTGIPKSHSMILSENGKIKRQLENYVYKLPSGLIVGVYENTTEKQKALNSLMESEKQFHQLFNSMKEGVAIYKPIESGNNFEIIDINNSGLQSSARTREDVVGKKVTDVFPGVRDIGLLDALKEVHRSGTSQTLPISQYKDHQVDFWVENHVFRLPSGLIAVVYEDATEKYLIREALIRSEEKYRNLVENMNELVFILDHSGNFTFVSNSAEKIAGYKPEELIGRSFTEIVHEEDLPQLLENYQKVISGNDEGSEYRVYNKNRDVIWVRSESTPIYEEGEIIGVQGLLQDITERRQQERDLVFQSMILDQINENITVTDFDGVITYVNKSAEKITGKPKSEIIGQTTLIFGEDPERGATQKEIVEKTLKEGDCQFEIVNFDADNNEHIMDCRTQILTDEVGTPVALCGIATDVTEQKQVEAKLKDEQQRFRNFAEMLPDVVFEVDLNMKLTYVNERAFELFGYTKEDFNKGIGVSQIIAPESREKAVNNAKRVFSGEKLGLQDYLAVKKDGSKFPVLVHSNQILNDGAMIGLRGILTDITERQRAEEEIKTAYREKNLSRGSGLHLCIFNSNFRLKLRINQASVTLLSMS